VPPGHGLPSLQVAAFFFPMEAPRRRDGAGPRPHRTIQETAETTEGRLLQSLAAGTDVYTTSLPYLTINT
jgi:hypothetical protein